METAKNVFAAIGFISVLGGLVLLVLAVLLADDIDEMGDQ